MKAIRDNRTIHLSELPTNTADFSICINYRRSENEGPGVLDMAITLDHIILPLIVKALNTLPAEYE
jgi:hypothetical protein